MVLCSGFDPRMVVASMLPDQEVGVRLCGNESPVATTSCTFPEGVSSQPLPGVYQGSTNSNIVDPPLLNQSRIALEVAGGVILFMVIPYTVLLELVLLPEKVYIFVANASPGSVVIPEKE